MADDWPELFAAHLSEIIRRHEHALEACGFDALIIAAGSAKPYFRDDIAPPFRANPQFRLWCPAEPGTDSCIVHVPGLRPVLAFHQPRDFWHLPPQSPSAFWAECFDVHVFAEPSELPAIVHAATANTGRIALMAEDPALFEAVTLTAINPPELLTRLDFTRACKTAYEVACLRGAATRAAAGHRAAADAFANGASEFAIHMAYLSAARHEEGELPYPNIVALNEHAAVLHYQYRDREPPGSGHRSLLIDAGASVYGYGTDVTRTHVREAGTFRDLVGAMDALQRRLVERVAPGGEFLELHRAAHLGVARILADAKIATGSPEALVEAGVTGAFLPHGLGHLLGLQTHDVGGHQIDAAGTRREPPTSWPALRFTRPLEPEMVFTVEPGLYFIPMLLDALRERDAGRMVDFEQVERLRPYGGIRIEDDVRVTTQGVENLTRPALESL